MALIEKLSAIADAIREKGGTTELLTLDEMPTAIAAIETAGSGEGLSEIVMTGDCASAFSKYTLTAWLYPYLDYIRTENITRATGLFSGNTTVTRVPFEINFADDAVISDCGMFQNADNIEYIAPIRNYRGNIQGMFSGIKKLVHCPEFPDIKAGTIFNGSSSTSDFMFYNNWSLRTIPSDFLRAAYTTTMDNDSYYKIPLRGAFYNCFSLDEIVGLSPRTGTSKISQNMFHTYTFNYLQHCKDIIFDTQEDGTPWECPWTGQIVYMNNVGWGGNCWIYLGDEYEVKDAATYAALKDNPNWFSETVEYSRYNHDSAVRTINSLPDCTSGMSTGQTSQSNMIYFKGEAGSATDGGAINTLTEEEIAVATAKNWGVAFQ